MTKKIEITKTINVPQIITAKTYFWTPSGSASGRRSNEKRRLAEMEDFVNSLPALKNVEIKFDYSESCRNIYKSFTIFRNGKKSNILGLRAECRKHGVELVW